MQKHQLTELCLKQNRLGAPKTKYAYGAYSSVKPSTDEHWIRITEGCPHNCPFCYEPQEYKIFGIPELQTNNVKIMDMKLLAKPEALRIICELGSKRVKGKVVHYELVCGVDYRYMSQEIAAALKANRFQKIRMAWDWFYRDQLKIKKAIDMLLTAAYKPNDIMIFMICNWKIPFQENCLKLDLCKVWNVQVADCYFDGQVFPDVVPVYWTDSKLKEFRHKCRKHNQIVNFKVDPEVKLQESKNRRQRECRLE